MSSTRTRSPSVGCLSHTTDQCSFDLSSGIKTSLSQATCHMCGSDLFLKTLRPSSPTLTKGRILSTGRSDERKQLRQGRFQSTKADHVIQLVHQQLKQKLLGMIEDVNDLNVRWWCRRHGPHSPR